MAIGLTFEEYVELKLMPPKHADRAFVTAAEHMRDEAFPMSLSQAAWHVRTRGYDCRPQSLELLVKRQVIEPADVDAWTRADVDAVCDYFEQHGLYRRLLGLRVCIAYFCCAKEGSLNWQMQNGSTPLSRKLSGQTSSE